MLSLLCCVITALTRTTTPFSFRSSMARRALACDPSPLLASWAFSSPSMLTITDLAKVYPTGTSALRGVSLTVDEPKVVAVIGPSGAGKSTLIRCINRLVEPTSGQVMLDGTDVVHLSRRELRKARRRMGMIFQEYNLVERLTVMENVLSGRLGYVSFWRAFRRRFPRKDVAAAFELLERVGLNGYHNTCRRGFGYIGLNFL